MSPSGIDRVPKLLRFPRRLSFEAGAKLVREIQQLPGEGTYLLDFTDMGWVEPFAMLHVASAVGRKVATCPSLTFQAKGYTNGYARFMGFFRELGIPDHGSPVSTENHENYLPIQALNLREVRADAARRDVAPGRLIETHTRSIARTLARQNYGPLWETLQYALREILRNAAEHSRGKYALYCGQYWPSLAKAEVAILDEGVGIATSLQQNPTLQVQTELDALKLSLKPGVSGVVYEGADVDDSNDWANSGFGLYVVSELCRRGGSLTVVSGQIGLRVTEQDERKILATHDGTALRLVIDTSNLRSIAASLALIVSKGERLAREYQFTRSSASGASKKVFD